MIYISLSFLTGITIVINMVLNGKLAQREGMINGIFINYFTAVISSILLCTVMKNSMVPYSHNKEIPLLYFIGGFIGVLTTFIFNIVVPKVPAVYVVILRFIGQMLASAVIDYIFLGIFSRGKVIGGFLFLIGLMINTKADSKSSWNNQNLSNNI